MEGTRVGHVRIERLLGKGGMGAVYLGFDEKLERSVAVKVLTAERRLKPEAKARFLREARLLSRLDDPRICRIHDLIEGEDTDFLVLEYIDGVDLAEAAASARSREDVLEYFQAIAEALAAAHREGIVHRDLKPDNVMVTASGAVKVLDFGIARSVAAQVVAEPASTPSVGPGLDLVAGAEDEVEPGLGPTRSLDGELAAEVSGPSGDQMDATLRTRVGSLVGTIRYMSPEQASGAEITAASDLYSLGVIMQEILTRTPVYGGSSGMDLLLKVYRAETEPPTGLEPEVARLIEDLTRIDAKARPSAEETTFRLQGILDGPRLRRRRRMRFAAAAVVVGAVLVAGAVAVNARLQARRQAELAQGFARQAEEIAWRMRAEHLSPAHDLRPAIAELRARMENLENQMNELGEAAEGPGHAALGRGYVALGNFDEARRHLELAADAGFRSPESDFALGIALGSQYGEELGRAQRIHDPDRREAEVERLNRELRDPALVHLKASLASPTTYPGYVRGLIALHEQRYEDALKEATQVSAAVPWFYEASMLRGDVNYQWAVAMGIDGRNLETERRLMLDAASAFEETAATARSYPRARTRLCGMRTRLIENSLIAQDGQLGEVDVDAAFAICQEALELDPGEAPALVMQSGLSALRARLDAMAGGDPGPSFVAARDLADRAIAVDPNLVVAHNMAGWVRFWSAQTAFIGEGNDPTLELDGAIENFGAVKRLSPGDPNVDIYLGDSYWLAAGYAHSTGGDPMPWIHRGLEIVEAAREARPDNPSLAVTLVNLLLLDAKCRAARGEDAAYEFQRAVSICESLVEGSDQPGDLIQLAEAKVALAEFELQRGEHPRELLDEAKTAADRAVDLSPSYFLPHAWEGWVGNAMANAEESIGGDPRPAADRAIADFERSKGLASGQYTSDMGIGWAHLLMARHLLDSGRSARSRLSAARRAIERAVELRPAFGELRRGMGELAVLEARQQILDGASPVEAFSFAEETLDEALETGFDDALTLSLKAELELWRARWHQARGEPPAASVERGLRVVDEALEINPRLAEAELIRGELELERSRIVSGGGDADEARGRSAEFRCQALATHILASPKKRGIVMRRFS